MRLRLRHKITIATFLVFGLGAIGLYVLVVENKEYYRVKIRQSPTASFLLDKFHKSPTGSFLLDKIRAGVPNPYPIDINKIPYSIFDNKSSWPIEDAKARAELPEFQVIPGLTQDELGKIRHVNHIHEFDTWHRGNGNAESNKYSDISQINTSNVGNLVPAWTYHSGENSWIENVENNPIIADGKIFATTPAEYLVSINAIDGTENWRTSIYAPARRGLLWWAGNGNSSPRLFVPSTYGVYAIDPATGKVISEFGNGGRVGTSPSLVAPAVDGNRLIIATATPSVEAYDAISGKPLWTTPLLKADAVRPSGPAEVRLGGGVPWSGFSVDSARSKIYVSTGNARPTLYGPSRPGRNEYSDSIVCIDSVTGQITWSFQEVAHDLWDFDVPSAPILVTIQRYGKAIDAVAAVTKIGNTLLLDRDSGRPIFDFGLHKAPVSSVPGERTWPYQPSVETPEPFMKQVFEPSDITTLSETARTTVERKLRGAQFGFFTPPAIGRTTATFGLHGGAEWPGAAVDPASGMLYVPANQIPWVIRLIYRDPLPNPVRSTDQAGDQLYQDRCGACHGAEREGAYDSEYKGDKMYPSLVGITASFGRQTMKQYRDRHAALGPMKEIHENDLNTINRYLSLADHVSDDRRSLQVASIWQLLLDDQGRPGSKPPWGTISAINLNTGKKLWQVPFGEYSDLTERGIPITGQPNYGGLIATKGGLIFATGTIDKKVRAYDARTGAQLWEYEMPAAGSAPPATFELNGTQYLLVVASGGIFAGFKDHSDTIMAFKLRSVQ